MSNNLEYARNKFKTESNNTTDVRSKKAYKIFIDDLRTMNSKKPTIGLTRDNSSKKRIQRSIPKKKMIINYSKKQYKDPLDSLLEEGILNASKKDIRIQH